MSPAPADKLLLRALRRETTPRRPLWIMRQAGRYLPEYRALRERHPFKALAGEPELAAEVTLQPLKRFPLDAAIVFADIMSPLPALGIEFEFDPGPVVAAPIRDAAAIARLREPEQGAIAPEVMRRAPNSPVPHCGPRSRCSVSAARRGRSPPTSSRARARKSFRRCAHSRLPSRCCSTTCSAG